MRILVGFCLFFFSVAGQSVGDSQSGMGKTPLFPSAAPRSVTIQAELETLSSTAEDIYDLAKMIKWNRIRKKVEELKKTGNTIKLLRNEENDFFSQRLRKKNRRFRASRFRKEQKGYNALRQFYYTS